MKRSVNMKVTARLQLLSFTLGKCAYGLDKQSMQEISRLEMITVIQHAGKQIDDTVRASSESRLSGRNARTNS